MELKQLTVRARREPAGPLLEPRSGTRHWWEHGGVFNPGVTEYEDSIILLYRAYDQSRISRLGLARSTDGVTFERFDDPAVDTDPDDPAERLGIEDPRITRVDDTYYIVHTAASYYRVGHEADVRGVGAEVPWRVRVAMHSTRDFRSFTHHGVILPDVPAKNGCVLPDKKNDYYGLYYRELADGRDVLKLAYTRDWNTWHNVQQVAWPPASSWQRFKFGTGSPPLVVDGGYLMVYHGVDEHQVYRLGLLMFDRTDPTRILWYSDQPILEPELIYEKEGNVPNVVYCCGAVIRGDELWLYYGGADKIIGRAVLPLSAVMR